MRVFSIRGHSRQPTPLASRHVAPTLFSVVGVACTSGRRRNGSWCSGVRFDSFVGVFVLCSLASSPQPRVLQDLVQSGAVVRVKREQPLNQRSSICTWEKGGKEGRLDQSSRRVES